jgi:hypothetical protein
MESDREYVGLGVQRKAGNEGTGTPICPLAKGNQVQAERYMGISRKRLKKKLEGLRD